MKREERGKRRARRDRKERLEEGKEECRGTGRAEEMTE
jgi:hypothetical protein